MALKEIVPEAAMESETVNEIPYYITECEEFYEGGPTAEKLFYECKKNPGHPTFIPVKQFKMKHLPVKYQTQEYMEYVQNECNLTVRVQVKYTSFNRPDTYPDSAEPYPCCMLRGSSRAERCGTGYIVSCRDFTPILDKPCPCHLCKESTQPEIGYFKVMVRTATHLIYDSLEASKAVFECFFDSNEREGVKYLYGENIVSFKESRRCLTDLCLVEGVTHDLELMTQLKCGIKKSIEFAIGLTVSDTQQTPKAFIVSHPHGMSKQISLGHILHHNIPNEFPKFITGVTYRFEIDMICYLPISTEFEDGISCFNLVSKHFQSFKQRMNSSNDLISLSEINIEMIESEKEYTIPTGTTFTLPFDSKYVSQFHYPKTKSFMLPPLTRFTLPNGNTFSLPCQTEFYPYEIIYDAIGSRFHLQYLTYNIATCPGSSGAGIFHFSVPTRGWKHSHAGTDKNGLNQSSLVRRSEFLPVKHLPSKDQGTELCSA